MKCNLPRKLEVKASMMVECASYSRQVPLNVIAQFYCYIPDAVRAVQVIADMLD